MTLKRFIAATIMLCAVGGAWADDKVMDIGVVPTSPSSYGDVVVHQKAWFTDTVKFSVADGTLAVSANVLNVAETGGPNPFSFNISGLTYDIWQGATKLATYPGGLSVWQSPLTAGDYWLKISGDANGTFGGAYGLSLSVMPVPEPATYGMLMVGIGLIGIARRRRNASNDKFM
jgi:hypothetical protein